VTDTVPFGHLLFHHNENYLLQESGLDQLSEHTLSIFTQAVHGTTRL